MTPALGKLCSIQLSYGGAVIVTAGGFCQTDTLLARRARVLGLFGSGSPLNGRFSKSYGPRNKEQVVPAVGRRTILRTRTAVIHLLFLVEATLDAIRLST